MNCTNCGAEIKDGVKFCTNCGANLSQQVVQSEPEQVQTPTASMDVPATSEGAVPLQKRNTQRTIAIACGLLILLVVVFVVGLFLWKSLTSKELLLDAGTIKDGALLNTLTVKYDKDGDGKLSEEELGEVQDLELDSGNDYSYLYLFRNLTSVDVKNSDVTSLDFSKNENLKKADFRDATNIIDIKLPDMPSYDDVKLPDNEDVNVTFPDNSEYEVKYVPKKVEETTITSYGSRSDTSTTTYTQDVQSATRINSLTTQKQGSSAQNITYSYDSFGRITAWGSSKDIEYDENNQVKSEAARINSGSYTTQNASYADNGDVSALNSETQIVNANGAISYATPSFVYSYWKLDSDRLSESVIYDGGASGSYTKRIYSWDGNRVSSLVLTNLLSDGVSYMSATDAGLKVEGSETISFEYDGNNMTKASYASGFTQNFTYDSHGNIIEMSSTGTPSIQFTAFTTNCKVEYEQIIGKKNAQALNFLILPSIDNNGLFHQSMSVRGITLCGNNSYSSYSAFTQDFSGKFWWDEENIINNQVEAAKARQNVEDSKSTVELASANNEALNNEAKEAYKAKISEYAQYQNSNKLDFPNEWFTGVNMLLLYNSGEYSKSKIAYSLYDLNADGVDELLINGLGDGITDAFAYDNGEVKRLFASGERWSYKLCKSGYLSYTGSSGADSHTYGIYCYDGNFDFSDVTNYYTGAKMKIIREAGNESGSAYYIGEDGIKHDCNSNEMKAQTQNWPKMEAETLDWTPITQNL